MLLRRPGDICNIGGARDWTGDVIASERACERANGGRLVGHARAHAVASERRLEAVTTRANCISVHATTWPRPEADMGRVGGRGKRAGGRGAGARSERRREASTTRTQRAKRTHCYRKIGHGHVIGTRTNDR